MGINISHIYTCVINSFNKKTIRLWGLSLLYMLLSLLAICLGALPVISIPLILTLTLGMFSVLYDSYHSREFRTEQLFCGFRNGFVRNCCGMAWMMLWIFIWALIPLAGAFIAIYKYYSYRFVPYILLTRPEISATEAIRISIRETRGYKGLMFGADIIIVLATVLIIMILSLLGIIPVIGWLFKLILFIFYIACIAFLPLLFGLVGTAFYAETHLESASEPHTGSTPELQAQKQILFEEPFDEKQPMFCPECGASLTEGHVFCGNCGMKLTSD